MYVVVTLYCGFFSTHPVVPCHLRDYGNSSLTQVMTSSLKEYFLFESGKTDRRPDGQVERERERETGRRYTIEEGTLLSLSSGSEWSTVVEL